MSKFIPIIVHHKHHIVHSKTHLLFCRDTNNLGEVTHASCQMYANVNSSVLVDYWERHSAHPDGPPPDFPYNETASEFASLPLSWEPFLRTLFLFPS